MLILFSTIVVYIVNRGSENDVGGSDIGIILRLFFPSCHRPPRSLIVFVWSIVTPLRPGHWPIAAAQSRAHTTMSWDNSRDGLARLAEAVDQAREYL